MDNIRVTYTDKSSYSVNVKDEEVAKVYTTAVISVFKQDGLLDRIESIILTNKDAYRKILYQKEIQNA